MDYLDFGSSSDSDEEGLNPADAAMDSDEEERLENNRILRMLSMKSINEPSKGNQKMLDFEAEMEAELDRRASAVEHEGGMEHQRSLSRSSSTSSLNSATGSGNTKPRAIKAPPGAPASLLSSNKSGGETSSTSRKKVKFADPKGTAGEATPSAVNDSAAAGNAKDDSFYDNIYFDSDESEGENDDLKCRRKAKRKLMSNDELFYDPNSDAEDQAWVDKQRRKFYYKPPVAQPKQSSTSAPATAVQSTSKATSAEGDAGIPTSASTSADEVPLPKTDAVLNCPACFTVVCMDCQRHEFYAGQYRAMFVMNCKIDKSETLTVPLKNNKSKGRKGKQRGIEIGEAMSNVATSASDKFFPVRCKVCNSQIAVYDSEEIFHFFNCLASLP